MTHDSLFSGIGGFDLAAEWAGWTNLFNCEIDPFCKRVLKYHFPDATQYSDIRTTDFTLWRGRVDVLSGGFPCQPYSVAGKRKGTEDERHLWPQMLRAIREIRPRWVVGENVLGIVSWSDGLVFEQVHLDLEAEGYEVQSYVLPACGIDAPHKRYRTWFVAHLVENAECVRRDRNKSEEKSNEWEQRKPCTGDNVRVCRETRIAPDADSVILGRRVRQRDGWSEPSVGFEAPHSAGFWDDFPTQSPVCSRDDGLSAELDGITFSKWRQESIKAFGNAIVPQAAYRIFQTINKYENR